MNVDSKRRQGKTALHLAIEKGMLFEAIIIVKEAIISILFKIGKEQMASLFVKKGANVNAVDDTGKSPLDYAAELGN